MGSYFGDKILIEVEKILIDFVQIGYFLVHILFLVIEVDFVASKTLDCGALEVELKSHIEVINKQTLCLLERSHLFLKLPPLLSSHLVFI